ncbi:hypothetical protein B0H14DRAFT_3482735 [Mycena olivaceomarginata]|nr:hypothetical protein B0H14DRAFT_3482735 [Mycena olivaceomarginata]
MLDLLPPPYFGGGPIHLRTQRAKSATRWLGWLVPRRNPSNVAIFSFNALLAVASVEQHHYNKNTLTEDELVAQTELIMIAGQDTTTITLALGLLELFKAPESQDKLRAEIHSTVGGAPNCRAEIIP